MSKASTTKRRRSKRCAPLPGSGAALIAEERHRQMKECGWTRMHDYAHKNKEIALNAIAVLQSYLNGPGFFHPDPSADIWGLGCKHNKSPKQCLIVAGALIAAELDRLQNNQTEERP
jgi:hypothetical protein